MERVSLKFLKDCILEIIYPKEYKCLACDEKSREVLCQDCINDIKYAKDDFSYAYYYRTIKTLILKLKFEKNFNAGEILASLLESRVRELKKEGYIMTYVPISRDSLKKRGFNQCEFIAKELEKITGIEVFSTLEFCKNIRAQKTLSGPERRENVKGAFRCVNKGIIENKRIILLDDVYTTGATVKECEKILNFSGIKSIKILTIAKSDI